MVLVRLEVSWGFRVSSRWKEACKSHDAKLCCSIFWPCGCRWCVDSGPLSRRAAIFWRDARLIASVGIIWVYWSWLSCMAALFSSRLALSWEEGSPYSLK